MRIKVTREEMVKALGEPKTKSLEVTAEAASRWSFLDDKSKLWTVVSVRVIDGVEFQYIKH